MGEVASSLLNLITSNPYVASVIVVATMVIALAKFLGAIENVHRFFEKIFRPKPDETSKRLELLKREVLYCPISNDIPVKLNELRKFTVQNDLVERPRFKEFFSRWLSQPAVVVGLPCLNAFSHSELEEIDNELRQLQL